MSAAAEGGEQHPCRPGATSMRVACAASPRRTSAGVPARSISAKERPERPAHAERLPAAGLPAQLEAGRQAGRGAAAARWSSPGRCWSRCARRSRSASTSVGWQDLAEQGADRREHLGAESTGRRSQSARPDARAPRGARPAPDRPRAASARACATRALEIVGRRITAWPSPNRAARDRRVRHDDAPCCRRSSRWWSGSSCAQRRFAAVLSLDDHDAAVRPEQLQARSTSSWGAHASRLLHGC